MSLLQKSRSVELTRRTQPFYAKKQSYNLGEQVQVEIDTQREFLDMESLRIQFKVTATSVGGNSTSHPYLAAACIRNLRVKTLSGQMIGHELREYRGFAVWKLHQVQEDLGNTFFDNMEAQSALTYTTSGNTFQLSHKPLAHIFGIKEYYPAHFHQGLMVEVDLPQSATELFNANLPTAVTFSDIRILVDLVELKPELETEMVRLMEEQKLFVDYIEWLNQQNSIQSTAAGSEAYDVVGIDGRVKSAFFFRRANASASTDFWGSGSGRVGLSQYRFRLGSNYLNYSNIECGGNNNDAERTYELTKALDIHHVLPNGVSKGIQRQASGTYYGIGVKVDKAMSDVDEVISSQVDKDRNNMRVELVWDSSPAGSPNGYTYVVLDKRIQLLPGSVVLSVRS